MKDVREFRRSSRVNWAGLVLGVFALAGCSSIGSSPSPDSPSITDRFTSLFGASPAGQEPAKVAGPDPNLDCPTVDVRQGASTIQVNATGKGADAGTLRYQISISRTARECAISGPTMSMKVGIQGRVILGPAGAPGQVDVPLRLALVREGVEPKTIWTKFYKLPVAVPPGQSSVPFAYVEENLVFPVPSADQLAAYIVYAGFDQGVKEAPVKKTKKSKSR
jgi:hypothetical protein